MSDQKSSYGEPVDEPKDVDADVVGRAHEGLADAEAARREEPAADSPAETPDAAPAASSDETVVVEEPAAVSAAPATTPWYDRADDDEARWAAYAASAEAPDTHADDTRADDTPTVVAAPVVTPSEPVPHENPSVFPTAVGQPIFVQAPEAPRPRGNRGAAGAIGLLAAVAFAVLYLAATLGLGILTRELAVADVPDAAIAALTTWSLWLPVVLFFIGFWLLGALINRGSWGHWVVWGLLVGVAAWGGHILGELFQAPFWLLTAREGVALIEAEVLAPLAIVAFVLGRELTIWFGAWVARRGKRITELNDAAQREYERTLEAGPQLRQG
jgi:hypothetical protein